jgi:hypothetical protein
MLWDIPVNFPAGKILGKFWESWRFSGSENGPGERESGFSPGKSLIFLRNIPSIFPAGKSAGISYIYHTYPQHILYSISEDNLIIFSVGLLWENLI